jgi:TatD DNase family protein
MLSRALALRPIRSFRLLTSVSQRAASVVLRMSASPPLIDVDCNLWHQDLQAFGQLQSGSYFDILKEDAVMESNVVAMLSPSSTLAEAITGLSALIERRTAVDIGKEPSSAITILTTVGLHPYHTQDDDVTATKISAYMTAIADLISKHSSLVAAVGECGLDASDGFPPLDVQRPWFQAQIELAQQLRLPLFVHERLAFHETMEMLQPMSSSVPILIHCFTGTQDECRSYIERGYSISLSGYIFKEGNAVEQCLMDATIPLDKLMLETDAPYMGFANNRDLYLQKNAAYVEALNSKTKKRLRNSVYPNVPSSLVQVMDKVLACINMGRAQRGEDLLMREDLARQTSQNANQLFGFGTAGL